MKNDHLLRILHELGLSENESKVYLAALSLGPSTVLSIAKTAEIRRTTVYTVIDALKVKGLMYIEPAGFKQLYAAEHPEKLESIIESRKQNLARVLPEFEALYNLKGEESTIRYYEGLASIKTIYDTILGPMKPGDDYLVISDMQTFFDMDRAYFENFLQRRNKARVKSRLIASDSKESRYLQKYAKNLQHEIKILAPDTKLSVDVMITPYKVTIFNLAEPISAISIENPAMIQLHKEMFEIMWGALK